jgi:hypothetical protein
MKKIIVLLIVCLCVVTSCRHNLYDDAGVVTKVKSVEQHKGQNIYKYKVVVEGIDNIDIGLRFNFYTNINYQVGDTIFIRNKDEIHPIVKDTIF